MEVVVSTRNEHKFKEISKILKDAKIKALNLNSFPGIPKVKEDGKTFADNACKKALKIAGITKRLTVADDSGLEVYALNNAPGIYSARFSGRGADYASNNKKLLRLLKKVPANKRGARFVCCAAVADAKGIIGVVEGICKGIIAFEEKGKKGFGYDPLFVSKVYNKTFAQLNSSLKNKISHRAKAFAKAKKLILHYIEKKEKA
ncbi:MAG: RdgB/HAM1 family non-canonical purine NTP pyrophosphatase [Candidatus Omnitrophica bacterium]|nr:RdgB/HAM1 family non-canonical purine NTP pyrophosphatase [Candidatus Omnitrophota bacterium]